jgi:hypothetical protein
MVEVDIGNRVVDARVYPNLNAKEAFPKAKIQFCFICMTIYQNSKTFMTWLRNPMINQSKVLNCLLRR